MTISIGYTEPIYVKSRYNPSTKKVNFRGIFADGVFAWWPTKYCEYTAKEIKSGNQDFLSMKESMTAIFRELGSQFAISKLLPNNEKCKIIILGCSDGSAAYSYAIMLRKFLGRQAKNNIKISCIFK